VDFLKKELLNDKQPRCIKTKTAPMHKGCLDMLFDSSRNYMAIERVHNSPNSDVAI
jgi:hypothetical protein